MDTTLSKTAPRIAQCIKQYGADRTNILILIQPGQASCLQALQYFLLTKVVSSVSTAITAIATQTRLSVATCRNDSSSVAMPVANSAEGMPNVVVCRSCKDARDLITFLLDLPKYNVPRTILTPLPMAQAQRQQQDTQTMLGTEEVDNVQNPWSNWFYTATSTITGSILSTQECEQLRRELCTIKTISLATSSQFRGNCQLRDPVAKLLEGFFETDQPL
ncbi:MAG: hypothetical protein J3Q66DRAFT_61666 [Benniella sp.]|nr:MAG: hypothetical protein J3Q66DRAFT_61666 [Benniella sp.]